MDRQWVEPRVPGRRLARGYRALPAKLLSRHLWVGADADPIIDNMAI